jgi:hypothetical protein
VSASTFARASYDIPGSEQRFARQRAWRDAEDRTVQLVAQNIRNRLASYFVAGTWAAPDLLGLVAQDILRVNESVNPVFEFLSNFHDRCGGHAADWLQFGACLAGWGTDGFLFVFKGLRLGKATFFAHEKAVGIAALPIARSLFGRSISCQWGEEFMPSIARCAVRATLVR